MNLSKEQSPKLETMSCEPHWPSMFDFAISKTMSNVPVNEGQALIVEMLEYGKRLYLASNEGEGETEGEQ